MSGQFRNPKKNKDGSFKTSSDFNLSPLWVIKFNSLRFLLIKKSLLLLLLVYREIKMPIINIIINKKVFDVSNHRASLSLKVYSSFAQVFQILLGKSSAFLEILCHLF